jgi:hypothetical protein
MVSMTRTPEKPRTPADAPASLREALGIFVSHASPRLLLALLAGALAARVAVGNWSAWDLVPVPVVVAYWPLQEWLIHVLILHWRPRRLFGFTIDGIVPRDHRAHHSDPWNYAILFIPFHSFFYTVPILLAGWWWLAPTPSIALTGVCAHLALTLHYEAVHFLIHTRVTPRTWFYRRLWRNHRLHHFRNEHYWYGVTMLSGDRLLRTSPDPDTVPTSPTARALPG